MTKLEELFLNNCKRCKYYDEETNTCCYGSWNRFIEEAIEEYLMTETCTFEGDGRFYD